MEDMIDIFNKKMKDENISVYSLAKDIGMVQSTLSRILSRKTKNVSAVNMDKIKKGLNIDNDYIIKIFDEKVIQNMEITTPKLSCKCTVCGNDNISKIKQIEIGRNNQITVVNLCHDCRKKLAIILIDSL